MHPKLEYFTGFKGRPFAPSLLSQDCFSHPNFRCKRCHWVAAAAGCLRAWQSAGQQSCFSCNYTAGTALPRRELPGEQMGLLRTPMDGISHHSVLTRQSWDLICTVDMWESGQQLPYCCLLSGSQTATALIQEKLQLNVWGPYFLFQVGPHSFQTGMWGFTQVFLMFFNERSSGQKAATSPGPVYI